MRLVFIAIALLALTACEDKVGDQIQDYERCKAAGMDTYVNAYGDIRCAPPGKAPKPTE
ncbi:hypothetical protein D3C81_1180690 [compost metagenome]